MIEGAEELIGVEIRNLDLFAKRGKAWSKIPHQVDEKNEHGDYVLSDGLPYTKNTDDGIFDANDELVFWGEHVGESFTRDEIPAATLADARQVSVLRICRHDNRIGDLLVVWNEHPKNYLGQSSGAWFDRRSGVVTSDLYEYKFHAEHPALLGDVVLLSGGEKFPIFAKSQFLMPLETAWYLPDLWFRDEDFTSRIESWQVGPVRTIVAVGVKYSAFLGLFKLHLFSELVFYRNRFQIPTVIEFMFEPDGFLNPGSGLAYALTFPEGRPWEIRSNLERLPADDPEKLAARRGDAAKHERFFARGSRPEGSFQVEVVVDPEAAKQVPPPFLIGPREFDGPAFREHWPWLAEIPGDLGLFLDISMVKKGTYDFGLDLVLSPKAKKSFADYGFVSAFWSRVPILDSRGGTEKP